MTLHRPLLIAPLLALSLTSATLAAPAPAPAPTGLLAKAEAGYQAAADAKRRNDVLKIAALLEEYKAATGHHPYFDRPLNPPYGKLVYQVLIAMPSAEKTLKAHPERWTFGLKLRTFYARDLIDVLSAGLKRPIRLPVDPQKVSTGAPNAYVVYFLDDDTFLITAYLYSPTPSTARQPAGGNLYAVASDNPGAFLSGIGLGARPYSSITPEEKAATAAAAAEPEATFAKSSVVDTNGR